LAGLISTAALAGQTLLLTIGSLTFMVPLGVGIAATVRTGNLLGANQPGKARVAAIACLTMIFGTSLLAHALRGVDR